MLVGLGLGWTGSRGLGRLVRCKWRAILERNKWRGWRKLGAFQNFPGIFAQAREEENSKLRGKAGRVLEPQRKAESRSQKKNDLAANSRGFSRIGKAEGLIGVVPEGPRVGVGGRLTEYVPSAVQIAAHTKVANRSSIRRRAAIHGEFDLHDHIGGAAMRGS